MVHSKFLLPGILCLIFTLLQSENLPEIENTTFLKWFESYKTDEKIRSGELNVLSYNTWGLPIELSGHDHQIRFTSMADSILKLQPDIVGLQETFHPDLRSHLLNTLPRTFFTNSDYHCNKEIIPFIEKDCYGGLMTLSVYPIIWEQFYSYPIAEETTIIEKIGSKGFLFSRIKYGDRIIQVINTHLYAGDNKKAERMRLNQIRFMQETVKSIADYSTYETILMGDFNVHHPDVACSDVHDFIIRNMEYEDSKPNISQADFTSDHSANKYVSAKDKRTKLDYIFYKPVDEKKNIKVMSQSRALVSTQPMSDHFGWKVRFQI